MCNLRVCFPLGAGCENGGGASACHKARRSFRLCTRSEVSPGDRDSVRQHVRCVVRARYSAPAHAQGTHSIARPHVSEPTHSARRPAPLARITKWPLKAGCNRPCASGTRVLCPAARVRPRLRGRHRGVPTGLCFQRSATERCERRRRLLSRSHVLCEWVPGSCSGHSIQHSD